MVSDVEPSADDLAAIEREWPLIAAELDLLNAELALLSAEDASGPTVLDWRRCRRAEQRVMRAAVETAGHRCREVALVEAGLTDCGYGCKILRCSECGGEQVSHRAVYGCPAGRLAG